MASNYTGLGVQLMTTGEKAGTWGTLTNTNWNIMEQISGGYIEVDINGGAQTTTLSVSDGSAGAALAHRVVKFTGAITGNQIVTIPLDVQTFYFIDNATTGAYTVQFKYVSGSDSGVTWSATDKGNKILYAAADDGTNPALVDFGMGDVTLTGTQTLTNKTLTEPKFADGGFIADTTGAETLAFGEVSSPLNEFKITNAATGNGPILSSQGQTNVPINITPAGTGDVFINPPSSGSLAIKGNATNAGIFKIFEDTDLGSYHSGFTVGNLTEDIVYTLPLEDATTSGDALTSNASGTLSWTTIAGGLTWVVKTTTYTAVANDGILADTSGGAWNLTLPAGTLGDEIGVIDYAATFDSNNLTIKPDGSEKIQGTAADLTVSIERAGMTLIYSGSAQGWLLREK